MNAVFGDYQRLSKNPRLGAHDRQLLDRHVGFLNDIETRIKNVQPVVCTPPGQPTSMDGSDQQTDPTQLQTIMGLMVDLSVAAVICDVTRIVTLHVSNAINDGLGTVQTSLHNADDPQHPSDWHHFAHQAFNDPNMMKGLVAVNRWITKAVYARLLTQLDVPEGTDGSTYLDNSLVVWGNELGLSHYSTTIPTVMAGSAGGVVKTNRYIDYCDWKNGEGNPIDQGILIQGLPHNRFLVTCMQAMGLAPSDYEQASIPGYASQIKFNGNSPDGWNASNVGHWDLDHIGDPLPGVLT
jgi:hypothetical protein